MKLLRNRKWNIVIKLLICVALTLCVGKGFVGKWPDCYQQEKIYDYQNEFSDSASVDLDVSGGVTQYFTSKGSILSYVKVYVKSIASDDAVLLAEIQDAEGKILSETSVCARDLMPGSWNTISMDTEKMKRGEMYALRLYTEDGQSGIVTVLDTDLSDLKSLAGCTAEGEDTGTRLAVEIHQIYHYFSAAGILYFIFSAVVCTVFLGILYSAVLRFEEEVRVLRRKGIKSGIIYAVFMTLNILMLFNPVDPSNTEVQKFVRQIGQGIAQNYDVSRVLMNFAYWVVLAVVIMVLATGFIVSAKDRKQSEDQIRAWKFLDDFMVLGVINSVFRGISFFSDETQTDVVFSCSSSVILLLAGSVLVYILLEMDKKISFRQYQIWQIMAFSVGFPIAVLLNGGWENGRFLFGIQMLLLAVPGAAICFVPEKVRRAGSLRFKTMLPAAAVTASLFPLALSVYIELINVLAGRGKVLVGLKKWYLVSVLLMAAAGVFLAFLLKRIRAGYFDVRKITYPFLIIGVTALSGQISLSADYSADVVESANAGVLISDFLNFGKLPLVEHYGGHMLTAVPEGIWYGIVNSDSAGASVSPYAGMAIPVLAVLFYFLVSRIWNRDAAFWTALMFPFYYAFLHFGLGVYIILAVLAFIKKNSYFRASLIWLACLWCTLRRLDVGFAFDAACAAALAVYIFCERKWKAVRPLAVTLAAYAVVLGVLWCVLCIWKSVDRVSRLREFVAVSASNQNWAYGNIGDPTLEMYSWCYLFVPVLMAACLVYTIVSEKFRERAGMTRWMILVILGVSYFANLPRGIVRHSLAVSASSGNTRIVIWTAYFCFAIFISCFLTKRCFLPVFTGFILFNALLLGNTNYSEVSFADSAGSTVSDMLDSWSVSKLEREDAESPEEAKTYWAKLRESGEKVERVQAGSEKYLKTEPLRRLTELLLGENETYVDFMNRTLSYSLLKKENPVYLSQSPMQLSGEYSQECFIREISENKEKNPVVLMPYNDETFWTMDGIANVYRYYKAAEYIYQNYVPLCHDDIYAVWCLPERYEDLKKKAETAVKEEKTVNIKSFASDDGQYTAENMTVKNDGGAVTLTAAGGEAYLDGLQNMIDFSDYYGGGASLLLTYTSDTEGTLELYYTKKKDGDYSKAQSVSTDISKSGGTAELTVPASEDFRYRLQIPENSCVTVTSVSICGSMELIDYGYDCVYDEKNESGRFLKAGESQHLYYLDKLPQVWGEKDAQKSSGNPVVSDVVRKGAAYHISETGSLDKTNGNYLKLKAAYAGKDAEGFTGADDEKVNVTVCMGTMTDGSFEEKYRYQMTMEEGTHTCLIRCSSDYLWYSDTIDTVMLYSEDVLTGVDMEILEGD